MSCSDDSLWMFERLTQWFHIAERPLAWRAKGTSPWGVLLSEVMSQQTPVSRVEPMWLEWIERWPTPTDLAAASTSDVLAAWGRLGYPRRALRLHECARAIRDIYGGQLPADIELLEQLPGIGSYTAAAVASFAFHRRAVVLDTNIRRVFARFYGGAALPPPSPRASERHLAAQLLPEDDEDSALWNVSVMELGALLCKSRSPLCDQCPLSERCRWFVEGQPADEFASRRRTQAWHGTDRQARGRIIALLREHHSATLAACLRAATIPGGDNAQPNRAVRTLTEDGLIHELANGDYALGSAPAGE
ncbi:A/G-specific adenine glycosylase [Actinomyces vulturis]|uniref:A/G-specific adenine glycosylase n=1 Tax=Actinomyces vulturis TaxID=1857645 RepID=UPI0008299410|nr:A/G-specific adenine glycosylase [Actinomyces vulturis]